MKKYFILVFSLLIFSINLVIAQSISFNSPTMYEDISGGTSQTLIPITLTYTSVKKSTSWRIEYIKLVTHGGTIYQDDLGDGIPSGCNGIPTQWDLLPGTYTWYIEQYEFFGPTVGVLKTASNNVTFDVKHTIKVQTNVGGKIKYYDNGYYKTEDSGYEHLVLVNEHIAFETPDQKIYGSYYIWKPSGSTPSEWTLTKYQSSELSISTDRRIYPIVSSNDNNAVFKSYLRYDETPPAAPTNLQISESQDEHPVLNWTANTEPDLEEYNIYRKGGYPFIDWVVIETVNSTTYEDIELTTTYSHGEDYFYKITAVDVNNNESEDYSNTVEVEARLEKQNIVENLELKPKEYALNSNYPNPFNPTTNISYQLPKSSNVTLKVYDMLGKEVAELVNENKSAGVYNVSFNASNLPSGLYFYKIQADEFTEVRKMLLMK